MEQKYLDELSKLLGVEHKPKKIHTPTLKGSKLVGPFLKGGIPNGTVTLNSKGMITGMTDSDFDLKVTNVDFSDGLDFTGLGTDIHKAFEEKRTTIVKGDPLVLTSGEWIVHKGIVHHKNDFGEWFDRENNILFVPEKEARIKNYATYKVLKKNDWGFTWPLNIGTCKEHCVKMEK